MMKRYDCCYMYFKASRVLFFFFNFRGLWTTYWYLDLLYARLINYANIGMVILPKRQAGENRTT